MKSAKLDDRTHLVRFERGEDLLKTLTEYCNKHQVKNATFSALGAIEDPTVAHYSINDKKYSEKKLEGVFEITNLVGNVALFEGDIVAHPHVTLSDANMQVFGGHLIHGVVSATVEMTITTYQTNFEKKMNDEIGIKLLDLPEESNL